MNTIRCTLPVAVLALLTPVALFAEEIQGRVIGARGMEVRIRLEGDMAPSAGDSVDLYTRVMEGTRDDSQLCGQGTVRSVEGDVAVARIDGNPTETPARGQRVTIHSEKPAQLDAQARRHDPLAGSPPTEEQARPFADALQRECAKGEFAGFVDAVDLDAIQIRALGDMELSGPMREIYTELFDGLADFLPEVLGFKPAARPSACRLLGFRSVNGEARQLFRLLGEPDKGAVHYVELVLLRSTTGTVRVIDAWRVDQGELVSEFLRRLFVPDAQNLATLNQMLSPSALDVAGLMEEDPAWVLRDLVRQEEFDEALACFDRNAALLRPVKFAHLLRIRSASYAAPDLCPKVVAEAEKAFPDDAAVACAAAHALEKVGRPEPALAAFDRLDKALGGDPYLNIARARIHSAAGRWSEARICAARATAAEATLMDGWQARLDIALQQKDFAEAARLLTASAAQGFQLGDMKGLSNTGEFLKSGEYESWLREHDRQ